jgi:hypothetical protein
MDVAYQLWILRLPFLCRPWKIIVNEHRGPWFSDIEYHTKMQWWPSIKSSAKAPWISNSWYEHKGPWLCNSNLLHTLCKLDVIQLLL